MCRYYSCLIGMKILCPTTTPALRGLAFQASTNPDPTNPSSEQKPLGISPRDDYMGKSKEPSVGHIAAMPWGCGQDSFPLGHVPIGHIPIAARLARPGQLPALPVAKGGDFLSMLAQPQPVSARRGELNRYLKMRSRG